MNTNLMVAVLQKELETRLLTEKELRQQLVVYNEKFETFQVSQFQMPTRCLPSEL